VSTSKKRITINASKLAHEDLEWLIADTGMTQTDLLEDGIRLLRIYRETVRSGGVLLRRTDGELEAIYVL
jgi:hypothetical protein